MEDQNNNNSQDHHSGKLTRQYLLSLVHLSEKDLSQLKAVMKKTILDTADVCIIFNRSVDTVRRWRKQGYLDYSEVGPSIFYSWDDVEMAMVRKGRRP